MIDRRALLLAMAATAGTAQAAARPLADQPPLPASLDVLGGAQIKDEAGKATTLDALLGRRRASIVSFWATWCAPCAAEGRHLAKVRAAHPEEQLAILGVNIDAAPDAVKMAAFRRRAKMTYAQGLEGLAAYKAFTRAEKVSLPRTFVFDAQGRPIAAFGRFFGARTFAAIDQAVGRALA
jgi:thiol-disulfide isomerase/thioredoxin